MKKFKTALAVLSVVTAMSISVNASEPTILKAVKNAYNVKINGFYLTSGNYLYESKLYVPVRDLCESLGAEVLWDDVAKTVTVKAGENQTDRYKGEYNGDSLTVQDISDITVYPDAITLKLNGSDIQTDNFILDGKTYVPVDVVSTLSEHYFVDNSSKSVKLYNEIFNTKSDYAYINGEEVSKDDLFDIADFVYGGDISNGLKDSFSSLDNYFTQSHSVIKTAQTLGIDLSDRTIEEFMKNTDITKVASENAKDYTDTAKKNIMKYFYAYNSLYTADLTSAFNPTEEELKDYYKTIKYSSNLTIKAQHILIEKGENNEGLEKIEGLLEKAREEDCDFTALMLENSQDPGSQNQPEGYIFTEGEMVEEFYENALNTPVGEISDVFETSYGYHIVKKIAQWDNGIPLEEIKETVVNSYNSQRLNDAFLQGLTESDVYFNTKTVCNDALKMLSADEEKQ